MFLGKTGQHEEATKNVRFTSFLATKTLVWLQFSIVVSRPAGPNQPPIQWVPGAFLLGIKWQVYEADRSLHRQKWWSYGMCLTN
jgi:hypothetical protein